jgi:hypothetical protein
MKSISPRYHDDIYKAFLIELLFRAHIQTTLKDLGRGLLTGWGQEEYFEIILLHQQYELFRNSFYDNLESFMVKAMEILGCQGNNVLPLSHTTWKNMINPDHLLRLRSWSQYNVLLYIGRCIGNIRKCCRAFQFLLLHKKPSFVPSESGDFILGFKHADINPYFHRLQEAMDLSLNTSKLIKRYNIQKPLRIFTHKKYCLWSMRMTYFTNTRFQNQNANWTDIHNRIDSGETFDDFRDTPHIFIGRVLPRHDYWVFDGNFR